LHEGEVLGARLKVEGLRSTRGFKGLTVQRFKRLKVQHIEDIHGYIN
jgi:hypothetical protein